MKAVVLGAGGMGETVLTHLKDCDLDDFIGYDIRPERIIELNNMGFKATTDLKSLLTDPEVKIAFVTSSNDSHYELVMQALEAGKAVMTEKPMATTIEDSEKMVKKAAELELFFQVGFELRYSKLYTKIKDWIDQGLLGDIVNTNCLYATPVWGNNYWRIKDENTGGMFAEKLCHYVDLPRWWIGDEVQEVITFCAPNVVPYYEVKDNYQTTYKFKNGAISHLTYMMGPVAAFDGDPLQDNVMDEKVKLGHYLRYTIAGTKGAAETAVYARSIKRWEYSETPDKLDCQLKEELTWEPEENQIYYHNTYNQTIDIVDRVKKGLPPKTPASDALKTMKLTFAAEQSAENNCLIKL